MGDNAKIEKPILLGRSDAFETVFPALKPVKIKIKKIKWLKSLEENKKMPIEPQIRAETNAPIRIFHRCTLEITALVSAERWYVVISLKRISDTRNRVTNHIKIIL